MVYYNCYCFSAFLFVLDFLFCLFRITLDGHVSHLDIAFVVLFLSHVTRKLVFEDVLLDKTQTGLLSYRE